MKKIWIIAGALFLASCGSGKKGTEGSLTDIKVQLEGLKKERATLDEKISTLEEQLLKLDTAAAREAAKLVEITPIILQDFEHFIDLQGKITTENIYYVSPRGMGGQVKAIYVKQGDRVRSGQLLLKLDDAIVRQQIATLQSQLTFAKDLYTRQQNVWSQGIGTEVQVLNAKNAVENLEKQMALLNEQLSMTNVYAQVSGIAETVTIRVGEVFTGNPMMGITIVNPTNLKAVVDVPENYLARIAKGTPVVIDLPDLKKSHRSVISLVSETIGQTTRSFVAEAKLPADPAVKPNQVAIVRILDHASKNAVVVPLATLQSDEKGKFVFVMEEADGKRIARKKTVTMGELYDESVEIRSGLSKDEKLITKGFQGLYDGQLITSK
jgi:RND family efflux transporter MFP subunit